MLVKSGNKRIAERRATLFDGILVLSKRKRSVQASAQAGASGTPVEYKLKDLIFTRKVEIKDREDTDGEILVIFLIDYVELHLLSILLIL